MWISVKKKSEIAVTHSTYHVSALFQGFMWETAEEFGALIVFAEHRYYGDSMPYGNRSFDSPANLGYLTSQQALADYVDLIEYLRRDEGSRSDNRTVNGDDYGYGPEDHGDGTTAGHRSNPVFAFGGSYGGMLAAWFRIKYPAIIEGLVSLCDANRVRRMVLSLHLTVCFAF